MAFLDTENNGLYPKGDPLEELDRELADLRKTLGELDSEPLSPDDAGADASADTDKSADISAEVTDKLPSDTDAQEPTVRDPDSVETMDEKDPRVQEDYYPVKASSGKKWIPAVIIALVLIIALVAGLTWVKNKTASKNESKIIFHDPDLGDVELDEITGAQINTLDNNNFSKDENGFPVYYENGKKISHLGVDLSENQGNVDFQALKNVGVEFVMLRVGGRFFGSGELYTDEKFNSYYEQAKAAGLKIGVYFFSQATDTDEAKEEAEYMMKLLVGKELDYPVAFDWEHIEGEEARTDSVYGNHLTSIAQAFCDAVSSAGYQPIVYSNTYQMLQMYDFNIMKDYDFWLADYRDYPSMYYKFDMWQYTTDGSVDGIEGSVDINLSFTDFS